MQALAWKHVADYQPIARAAAERDMGACREYAARTTCPLFFAIDQKPGLLGDLTRIKSTWRCAHDYRNVDDPQQPFR
jgi:hypothetical protein